MKLHVLTGRKEICYTNNKGEEWGIQMRNGQPSKTFKMLYNYIIADLLFQICDKNRNYCVKYNIGDEILPIALWKKVEEYELKATANMSGSRLDRHKLASCICGAIIEVRPLVRIKDEKISENANEILALFAALNIIKAFMMYDILKDVPAEKRDEAHRYLRVHFDMKLPSLDDNICDTQEYRKNIINALYWSHFKCRVSQKECFRYDIWAYSKIFYHLELYNKKYCEECYQEYKDKQPVN